MSRRLLRLTEEKVPRSALDQPQRQDLAEPAERAGDQVAPVRLDGEAGDRRFPPTRHKGLGKRGNDFSYVPAL